MLKVIGLLFASLIVMLGVICVYDARKITIKSFGFGDQNEATLGLKIIGFAFCIIGALIIYFIK